VCLSYLTDQGLSQFLPVAHFIKSLKMEPELFDFGDLFEMESELSSSQTFEATFTSNSQSLVHRLVSEEQFDIESLLEMNQNDESGSSGHLRL